MAYNVFKTALFLEGFAPPCHSRELALAKIVEKKSGVLPDEVPRQRWTSACVC
jgi:hypothetical protein